MSPLMAIGRHGAHGQLFWGVTLIDILHTIVPQLILSLVVGSITWLVGGHIAKRYSISQKVKEIDISTAKEFFLLYGEFFRTWKIWNAATEWHHDDKEQYNNKMWEVYQKSCDD